MALVAAAPLVAGGIHDITKGAKGPNASAMSWDYIAPDYGQWNANISNNNLRWMVIEVADNSTGVPVSISREHIRFAAQNAYPTGNATSMPVQMAAGRPYVITAIPNGPKGASAVVEDVFTVELPPVAEFTATMNWMDVSVDASASYDPDGMIMSWDWNWGDGMSGAGEMATHTYLMAGWYEITLTVTDNDGMTDTASAMVEAKEMPPELNAAFTATMNWMVVSVDASASTGLAPLSYAWDFGDGATDMGVTATHTYLAEGMYTITLTVTDGASATDTATAMVEAKMEPPPMPPVAAFTASIVYLDLSVDASASYDPDGVIVAWDWDFGDGMTGSGEMTTHSYATAGVKLVTLTVTDAQGLKDTETAEVTATEPPKPPVAMFTATMTYLNVAVDASASYDPDGVIVAWDWNFGDGMTGSGEMASHDYGMAGPYTITLTVTDSQGLKDTETAQVTATDPPKPPVAAFTASIVYLDLSVDASASYDPDGIIVAWDWDFGDGMTGSGEMTTHSYATAGVKLVTLTVTDAQGLKDTETAEVTATEPPKPPVASFIWSADYLVAAFDGSASTDPDSMIVAWDWDFGDGMVGSGETVSHTYAMAGTYTVVLKVTDSQTLWDEESKSVTVTANPPPVAAFTWSLSGQTLSVDAAGSSDDRAVVSWEWDWGDGTKGTGMTATHTYTKPVTSTHLILAAPGALAPVPPYTLLGVIYGPDGMTPMGNCIVTVTNTRTGDVINAVSDPDYGLIYDPNTGSYVDLANTPSGLLDGDVISVTATNGVYSGTNTGVAHPLTGAQMTIDVVLTGGIPPVFVDYTVTLTVKDAYGLSSSTSVTITVEFPGA